MKRRVGCEKRLELLEGRTYQLNLLKKILGLVCVVGLFSAMLSTKFNLEQWLRYVSQFFTKYASIDSL
jgi:hypothetical protein